MVRVGFERILLLVHSRETERARWLRNNMTRVEWRLWMRLRGRQLGHKFRRQVPIGPYFADFACLSARTVVEVDGPTHEEAYDIHRDRWLEARGWRVLHFSVQELDERIDEVVEGIAFQLSGPSQPPHAVGRSARNHGPRHSVQSE